MRQDRPLAHSLLAQSPLTKSGLARKTDLQDQRQAIAGADGREIIGVDMRDLQSKTIDKAFDFRQMQITIMKFNHRAGEPVLMGNERIQKPLFRPFDIDLQKYIVGGGFGQNIIKGAMAIIISVKPHELFDMVMLRHGKETAVIAPHF